MGLTGLDWMPLESIEICRIVTGEVIDWQHVERHLLCSCVHDSLVPAVQK